MTECPHCGSEHLQKWGWKDNLQRYRCNACRTTFNRLTGTQLARLRKKEQWPEVVESLKEKETLDQMQERLGISRMTAVLWRKRFLAALQDPQQKTLSGIVEADETFVRQSLKGSRIQNVNAYHSRLKRFLSRLRGVATRYLENYLVWLDYLDSRSADQNPLSPLQILKMRMLHT